MSTKSTSIDFRDFSVEHGFLPNIIANGELIGLIRLEADVEITVEDHRILFVGQNCKYARKIWNAVCMAVENKDIVSADETCRAFGVVMNTTYNEGSFSAIHLKGLGQKTIHAKTPQQSVFIDLLDEMRMVYGLGPAGTGKTYLAVLKAIQKLLNKEVDGIIITRPPVDNGERIGFLPGTEADKLDPYMRPVLDVLEEVFGVDKVLEMIESKVIQVNHLGYFRGRTFKNKAVIVDEFQNCTPEQARMIITRLGEASTMFLTGDHLQSDIPGVNAIQFIEEAYEAYGKIPDNVGMVYFSEADCVRDPIVAEHLKAFECHADWWENYKEKKRAERLKRDHKLDVEKQMVKHGDLPPSLSEMGDNLLASMPSTDGEYRDSEG